MLHNQRYKCLKAAQGKPHDNPQWDIYRAKRNAVRRMLRKAEASYWIGLFEESSSPTDFWKICNRVLGKSEGGAPVAQLVSIGL